MSTPTPATALAAVPAAPGSRLWPIGPHLVIAPEEAGPTLTAALSGLPPLPDAVLVLAASGLAAAGPDGTRPLESVATTAGFPVIAPDGMVTVEPDGSLRVTPPGTWWLGEPGIAARALAPAWPPDVPGEAEPPAEETQGPTSAESGPTEPGPTEPTPLEPEDADGDPLAPEPEAPEGSAAEGGESERGPFAADPDEGAAGEQPLLPLTVPVPVVAESSAGAHGFVSEPDGAAEPGVARKRPVPGGFWLGELPEAVEPLIGVRPGDLLLGVGSPQQPTLPTAELLDLVGEVVPEPDGLLLAAPWADPAELTGMAVALAGWSGRTVRAAVGLPVRTADAHATAFLDARGAPTWQPLLVELTASPEHRRVVPSAWLRLPGLDTLAPAVHRTATEGWVLETVPAGLWLRPEGRPDNPGPRMLRPDPARPVLVVGDRDGGAAPELWEALTGVLATLPDLGATAPYGLLYAPGADTAAARAWAEANGLDWLGPADDGPAPEPDHGPVQAARGLGAPGVRGGAPAPSTDLDQTPACPDASAPGPAAPVPVVTATTPPPPATTAAAAAPAAARRSGPADRAALRELLGDRYHLLASKSELLASRLPSLRSTLQDDLKPDMVAIALYQADTPDPASRADLVAAARAAAPGSLTPLLRCLGSGLRRLPGHYGAVMLAAPAEALPLDRYMPGSLLVEPAPVAAVPACDAELEGSVEFGIWSTTGRRTSVFGGPDDEPEVVFPPGTAFSVLALQPPEDDEGLIRVLLREISHSEAQAAGYGASLVGAPDDRFRERDDQARTRLTAWFERRDMLEPEGRRTLPNATRYHLSPGAAHR